MLDPFEISGHWWLPDVEDEKIAGTLRFSQEHGGKLELFGLFDQKEMFFNPKLEHEIILGKALDGRRITLTRCMLVNHSTPLNRAGGSSEYNAQVIFIGDHYQTLNQITFKSMHGSYTDLLSWLRIGKRGIELDMRGEDIRLDYHPHDPIVVRVNDQMEFSIEFHPSMDGMRKDGSFLLTENVFLVLKQSGGEIPFMEFLQKMRVLGNLLTLGVGRLSYPTRIFGLTDQSQGGSHGGSPFNLPIQIYYQLLEPPQERNVRFRGDMLFGFEDIEARLEPFVQRWFNSAAEIAAVHDLFFGSYFVQRLFVNHRFLNLVQAIETYHRSRLTSAAKYRATHRDRMDKILQAITPVLEANDVRWIESMMKGKASPSLKIQCQEIAERYKPVLDKWYHDHSGLTDQVIDTRHALTHHTQQEKAKTTSLDLFTVNRQLLLLLECALLEELGFSLEEVFLLQNERQFLPS